jgi:hypothetical protein
MKTVKNIASGNTKFLCLIALLGILSKPVCSMDVKTENEGETPVTLVYFSGGIGVGSKGGTLGVGGTIIFPNLWGVSIGCYGSALKNKNIPDDYFSDGHRTFSPRDFLTVASVTLVKQFSASAGPKGTMLRRFSIEAGPALVRYNVAMFELNPSYDPNSAPWFGNIYKYYKWHAASYTAGVTLKGNLDFLPLRHLGFGLAVSININKSHSVFGVEVHDLLGRIIN